VARSTMSWRVAQQSEGPAAQMATASAFFSYQSTSAAVEPAASAAKSTAPEWSITQYRAPRVFDYLPPGG